MGSKSKADSAGCLALSAGALWSERLIQAVKRWSSFSSMTISFTYFQDHHEATGLLEQPGQTLTKDILCYKSREKFPLYAGRGVIK
jgi:hypothetical protein